MKDASNFKFELLNWMIELLERYNQKENLRETSMN